MLNRLLKLLGDDAEIDDELYQKIFDNMLERLKDKVAEIRAQAVTALQRLQVKIFIYRVLALIILIICSVTHICGLIHV